jgi:hypothetical protein
MGFLSNLFGSGPKCATCANRIGPLADTLVVSKGSDPFQVLKNVGMRCPRCQELACVPCAVRAGKSRGETAYHCPICGEEIDEDCYLQ